MIKKYKNIESNETINKNLIKDLVKPRIVNMNLHRNV